METVINKLFEYYDNVFFEEKSRWISEDIWGHIMMD